jgi:hypothetical protein
VKEIVRRYHDKVELHPDAEKMTTSAFAPAEQEPNKYAVTRSEIVRLGADLWHRPSRAGVLFTLGFPLISK